MFFFGGGACGNQGIEAQDLPNCEELLHRVSKACSIMSCLYEQQETFDKLFFSWFSF